MTCHSNVADVEAVRLLVCHSYLADKQPPGLFERRLPRLRMIFSNVRQSQCSVACTLKRLIGKTDKKVDLALIIYTVKSGMFNWKTLDQDSI